MSWRADPKDFVCGVAMKDCNSSCVYMLVVSLCGNGLLMLQLISAGRSAGLARLFRDDRSQRARTPRGAHSLLCLDCNGSRTKR
jgi:hypothetical protein